MNKRNWTKEEDNYIVENFGKKTFSEMSKKINCAITTVERRAIELGLSYEKKTLRRWTKEQKALIKMRHPRNTKKIKDFIDE